MNHRKHYDVLISRARSRVLDCYSENHHIVPRCLGGSDNPENLVRLTPEEHYVAHQLLVKIHPGNHSLVHAAVMMRMNRPGNKIYGWLKRKHSSVMKAQTGIKNSSYGSFWITDGSISMKWKESEIPEGWKRGYVYPISQKAREAMIASGKKTRGRVVSEKTKELLRQKSLEFFASNPRPKKIREKKSSSRIKRDFTEAVNRCLSGESVLTVSKEYDVSRQYLHRLIRAYIPKSGCNPDGSK